MKMYSLLTLKKLKRTHFMQHQIITGDALPVKIKSRRIPNAWEKEVDGQIKERLGNDIIRPSSSPMEFSVTTCEEER